MNNKVSIIMPVYNSSKYLDRSIQSVINQTYSNYELVIVDDGSTDNSKDIITKYRSNVNTIKYIYEENKGIAGARNTGINNANGDYIALLDADDTWRRDKLESCVNAISNNLSVGFIYSAFNVIDENDKILYSSILDINATPDDIFKNLVLRKINIAAVTVLFRKKCCDSVGIFDESKEIMGVDDRDLWIRISSKYKCLYIPKILASWRKHPQNYSGQKDIMIQARINQLHKLLLSNFIDLNLYNKAISKVLKEAGDSFLAVDNSKARKYYFNSIKHSKTEFFSYINFLKTLYFRTK